MRRRTRFLLLTLVLVPAAAADEGDIRRHLRSFFETRSKSQRATLVKAIETDPAYNRGMVSHWLHTVGLFEPLTPGRHTVTLPTPQGELPVVLRIPKGYQPDKPLPLIYALHGQGGNGDWVIGYVERLLGQAGDQFVIAAPSGYTETRVDLGLPPMLQHRALLRGVKQHVNVDSDRVYAIGYSMGGHSCWAIAITMPEQFAGVMPIAGSFNLPRDYLAEVFLPNLANTYTFVAWGAQDNMAANRQVSPTGGIAGTNQRITTMIAEHGLPVEWHEFAEQGHGGVVPPAENVRKLFTRRRAQYPKYVNKKFRSPAESTCHWIEADGWVGGNTDTNGMIQVLFMSDEDQTDPDVYRAAFMRTAAARLAQVEAQLEGQRITVGRKKVREITIWIGDEMIDWQQPVEIEVSGKPEFAGVLEPDLHVCLVQAKRTYDFDRLRWAGVRYHSRGKTRPVTQRTEFLPWPGERDD